MTVDELKERMMSSEVTGWAAWFSNQDEDEKKRNEQK
jgi:hypothetical protein